MEYKDLGMNFTPAKALKRVAQEMGISPDELFINGGKHQWKAIRRQGTWEHVASLFKRNAVLKGTEKYGLLRMLK